MDTLGQRLRSLRTKKGLSLEEAGRLLSTSFNALAMYERNERVPPSDKLTALAEFYGVSTDYLLCRTNDPTPAAQPMPILSKRLWEIRTGKHFTLKRVAEETGLASAAIAAWEQGESAPSPIALERLAELYQVSTDYLLGRTNDPTPPSARAPLDPQGELYTRLGKALFKGELDEASARALLAHYEELERKHRQMLREAGLEPPKEGGNR